MTWKHSTTIGLALTGLALAALLYCVVMSSTVETEWKPGMHAANNAVMRQEARRGVGEAGRVKSRAKGLALVRGASRGVGGDDLETTGR